jgi:hypothetical protein
MAGGPYEYEAMFFGPDKLLTCMVDTFRPSFCQQKAIDAGGRGRTATGRMDRAKLSGVGFTFYP